MSLKKMFQGSVLTIVIVSIAYVAGTEAQNYFQTQKVQASRELINNSPIMNLNDLKIGDTIPDGLFEDLQFNKTNLLNHIHGNTIITFMSPNCNSCLEDIGFVYEYLSDTTSYNKFVYISYGNPRQLLDIQKEYHVKSPILYDHEGKYCSQFDVTVFPLHFLVDANLVVLDIYAGSITENDIDKVL